MVHNRVYQWLSVAQIQTSQELEQQIKQSLLGVFGYIFIHLHIRLFYLEIETQNAWISKLAIKVNLLRLNY